MGCGWVGEQEGGGCERVQAEIGFVGRLGREQYLEGEGKEHAAWSVLLFLIQ